MEVGHEIIQLGRHRLLCGDATNKEDVNKLLQGEVVDLLLTDAPYGISIVQPSSDGGGQIGGIGGPALRPFKRQGRTQGRSGNHTIQDKKGERERESKWGTIGGGKPATFKKTRKSRNQCKTEQNIHNTHTHTPNDNKIIPARTYKPIINDDKPFDPQHLLDLNVPTILFGGNYFADKLPPSNKWLVWYKKPSLDGNRNHFSDCELMWTNLPGKRVDCYHHTWSGMVRKGDRRVELAERVHPTQKPVGLLAQLIEDYTERGDTVLDLYGGSGSTLIACEETGRKCLMMELSPDYVQIIQQRYYAYISGESVVEDELNYEQYNVGGLDSWLT